MRLIAEEEAQTTAEYALVILGAAAVAGALITWAISDRGQHDLRPRLIPVHPVTQADIRDVHPVVILDNPHVNDGINDLLIKASREV